MGTIVLIAIILIAVVLVVVALLIWRRQKEEQQEGINHKKKAFFAQWIAGIVIALIGAVFMFDGNILGENTTGISTVIGIVGISLIATSNINLLPARRK